MTRPDDSFLTPEQLATVQRHADRLLRDAGALGVFPTPINTIMEAAKLIVVDDEVLNETFMRRFLNSAKAGVATIKSALSKVLGLFEANDRLVIIDRETPVPRIPFVKLHEAGHGTMPHQSKVYSLIHDCEKTLDPDITDLFEREANVFASEALFQGDVFAQHAHEHEFGVKTAIALAKQFGSSNYAAFRRYVTTNPSACCLVVLEPTLTFDPSGYRADVRRIIVSKTFNRMYDAAAFGSAITQSHPLNRLVPRGSKQRMVPSCDIVLTDRNGDRRECMGQTFKTKHQILILVRDEKPVTRMIVLPGEPEFNKRMPRST
ncbi:ImmA/IrrE family metallo-endopeptidase [Bradyrhizobium tunisiense]|uniref:ImmA/IrrE family metallo-endopeptidase n=1 Tax=Bradyrhizobium tunisiense TaxID=3278709 RepID=UPI0035E3B84C